MRPSPGRFSPGRVISELLGVRQAEQGQFRDWTRTALGLPGSPGATSW